MKNLMLKHIYRFSLLVITFCLLVSCGNNEEEIKLNSYHKDFQEKYNFARTINSHAKGTEIHLENYHKKMKAVSISTEAFFARYANTPFSQMESYIIFKKSINLYKEAEDYWAANRGILIVRRRLEEADVWFKKAYEAFIKETGLPPPEEGKGGGHGGQ